MEFIKYIKLTSFHIETLNAKQRTDVNATTLHIADMLGEKNKI